MQVANDCERPRRVTYMTKGQLTGVAFYRPEEWEALRELAPDRDSLENTYEEWLAVYNDAVRRSEHKGCG